MSVLNSGQSFLPPTFPFLLTPQLSVFQALVFGLGFGPNPPLTLFLGAIIAGTTFTAEITPIIILVGSCTGLFESFIMTTFTLDDPGFNSV